ncbi:hypothetical protein EJ02DRAFT_439484 [Clathrospora elynae]|uniref:Uncharacterized protein n=1 Tax=Clathrospora elynae TaxID=706981 RepID=A0A6A5S615_9PLEO|nr:hypothetical protein EJ02DRAFT_439484 [Clathrospora elynae]
MANTNRDGADANVAVHFGRYQQDCSFTYSDTNTKSNGSDTSLDDVFKLEMKLSWAERRNSDLVHTVQSKERENGALAARVRELEADNAVKEPVVTSSEYRVLKHDRLTKTLKKKGSELRAAKQEIGSIHVQLQALQVDRSQLSDELSLVKLELHSAKSRSTVANDPQALLNQQEATIAMLQDKIEKVSEENRQHAAKVIASLEAAKKNIDDISRFKAKKEKDDHALKDLRVKFAASETDRDWHRRAHSQLLAAGNTLAERAHETSEMHRLKSENSKLQSDKKGMEKNTVSLKWDMAFYITYLDLIDAGHRVFNCRHDHYDDIPDGANETRAKRADIVATEFFQDWRSDSVFIAEYNNARQSFLNHHRAHETAGRGRGTLSGQLVYTLNRIDRARGVNIIYE